MKEYELLYLIGETQKDNFTSIDKDVHAIIEKYDGTWLDKQVTEERRLAYEIKHERRGLYVAQRFTLLDTDECEEKGIVRDKNPITEMNRELGLHTGILRAIIISAEDLPPLISKEEKEALRAKKQQERELRASKDIADEAHVKDALHI